VAAEEEKMTQKREHMVEQFILQITDNNRRNLKGNIGVLIRYESREGKHPPLA